MHPIVFHASTHHKIRQSLQLAALETLLPDAEIEAMCREIGHRWRTRDLPPGVTLRSMVYRSLHSDHSIAGMLADLAARMGQDVSVPSDAAWCQARSRLPLGVPTELIRRRAEECRRRFGDCHKWHNKWVFRIDGSSVSMPDEGSLVQAFGYAKTRHGRSRFPVARVTFIELAGLNVIWDYRLGRYRQSEEAQLYDMWHRLPTGSIALLDRKFCSFYVRTKLRQRRIGIITPLHQRRDPQKLIRQGRRVGRNEWIVPLDLAPQIRRRFDDPSLPRILWVRLICVTRRHGKKLKTRWLVTTLMDRELYPAKAVAREYCLRWGIETRIGSLKTTLEMNVLRSKSPNAVRREVASIILGHNLVWMRMHEAAELTRTPVAKISFAGAVKVVLAFSPAFLASSGEARRNIHRQMLLRIASLQNHHPRNRVEPRLIKRETARFAYLRESRAKAREKCLS